MQNYFLWRITALRGFFATAAAMRLNIATQYEPTPQLRCASFELRSNACQKQIRNLAVYRILWLRPLRLTSLRELAYAETLRWFSRFMRSVRLCRVNNALQRIYSTDMPCTGNTSSTISTFEKASDDVVNASLF